MIHHCPWGHLDVRVYVTHAHSDHDSNCPEHVILAPLLHIPLSKKINWTLKLTGLPLSRMRLSILSDMSPHLPPMAHQSIRLTTHQRKNRACSSGLPESHDGPAP